MFHEQSIERHKDQESEESKKVLIERESSRALHHTHLSKGSSEILFLPLWKIHHWRRTSMVGFILEVALTSIPLSVNVFPFIVDDPI